MAATFFASKRRHARSAINTIQAKRSVVEMQADRRSVVEETPAHSEHLEEMRQSVLEKVLFPDGNPVLRQELPVLFRKRLLTMMLLLLGNIADYHVLISKIVGKSSILLRPSVKKRKVRVGLEPLAGGNLEFLDKFGHSQGCWQGYKKVYMVGHASDAVKVAVLVVNEPKDIGVKLALVILITFGHEVNEYNAKRIIQLTIVAMVDKKAAKLLQPTIEYLHHLENL